MIIDNVLKKSNKKRCVYNIVMFILLTLFTMQTVNAGQIFVSANRDVILDDPSGWVGGGVANQWSGESTTIRWYVLVLDSNGHAMPGVTVATSLIRPNGLVNYSSSATTDSNGYVNFSRNMDSFNQVTPAVFEGSWTVNATATVESQLVRGSDRIIYDEYGCGKSGSGCHTSNWQTSGSVGPKNPAGTWGWGTSTAVNSPYVKNYDWDIIHGSGSGSGRGHGSISPSPQIASGECITCHKSYNGIYVGSSIRQQATPQYPGGDHANKVGANCTDCHGTYSTTNAVTNMPIKTCYDCHPKKNNNVSIENYVQSNSHGYSYLPLDIANSDIRAHNSGNTTACITCHGGGHNITKPNNTVAMSNTYTENEQCWACHNNRPTHYPSSNSNCVSCHTQDTHRVSLGGGPDCISCHSLTGAASHKVDTGAISLGEHANLNSGATASGVSVENKKCWGCHQTGGTRPTSMGDRYADPYKCYDCHNATKPYLNVGGALTVDEHFKSGTDIKSAISAANDSASCLECHNVSEMKVSNAENDGFNTGFSLASHYGKNRSDLRVGESTDCAYCHQNGSTTFSGAMSNVNNKIMDNHSTSVTTPLCTTCHGSGKIHDSSLSKPISDDTYCKTCHTTKSEHKTLRCTECHANNTDGSKAGRDIHGIKYLQKDNTFSTANANVVDCTTCHQKSVVDDSIGMTPVKISDSLHHSDDINNGSKWGNYWTTPQEACLYCHNNTKHSIAPLGRPLLWNSGYVLNTLIGEGTNCADCHQKGDSNYGTMITTFTSAGREIPPEITNGSWNGKFGYYNHTLSDYTDSQCKSCHDKSGGGSTTVGQLTHNASIGTAGGPDCKSCHDIGGSAPFHVNFSALGEVDALHSGLNSGESATVDSSNKKCWACHGNGIQPVEGHPSNYKTPRTCENCHVETDTNFTPSNTILKVSTHYFGDPGTNITRVTSCYGCHNKSEMMIVANDPDLGTINGGLNTGDKSTSHYGKKRGDLVSMVNTVQYCDYCHNSTDGPFAGTFTNADNRNILGHSRYETSPKCQDCHSTGRIHNVVGFDDIVKGWTVLPSVLCINCHGQGGTATMKNKSMHNGTVECSLCHLDTVRDIHPVKYLTKDSTFSIEKTNAVNCTDCHQGNGFSRFVAPIIPGDLQHSSNSSNGTIWGNYWTSEGSACIYCHGDTRHNSTGLGKINVLFDNPENTKNGQLANTDWCADCHRSSNNVYYRGNQWSPAPPTLLPQYHNSMSNYNDSGCKLCHSINNPYLETPMNYTHSLNPGGGDNCMACHTGEGDKNDVNISKFGRHANLSTSGGLRVVSNEDCWTCHYNKDMNNNSIYLCESCHTSSSGIVSVSDPTLIMPDFDHGPQSCKNCHAPYKYHMDGAVGPKGFMDLFSSN